MTTATTPTEFTFSAFDLQTLLVWERHKPKHLRTYNVLWVLNISSTGQSMTMLPRNETPSWWFTPATCSNNVSHN